MTGASDRKGWAVLMAAVISCGAGCGGGGTASPGGAPGGNDASAPGDAADQSAATGEVVGPAGGTVTSADGTTVVIPAGALTSEVSITIEPARSSPTPAGATVVGAAHTLGPEGQLFTKPVTVRLAFEPVLVPPGASVAEVRVLTAARGAASYQVLSSTVSGTFVEAQTTHFSTFVPAVPLAADGGAETGDAADAGVDATDVKEGDASDATASSDAASEAPVVLGDGGAGTVVAITTGWAHACALLAGGTAKCWGRGAAGQLGNGSLTRSSTPVEVSNLQGAVAISAGYLGTCAVVSGGAVWCWGGNNDGELGAGVTMGPQVCSMMTMTSSGGSSTTTYNYCSPAPVMVSSLTGAKTVALGTNTACAVAAGGVVSCWGDDHFGGLGGGAYVPQPLISAVPIGAGVTGASALVPGCALLGDETVACWGDNLYGQLGRGSTTRSPAPAAVTGLAGVKALAASSTDVCAVLAGGSVSCWGQSYWGQLGDLPPSALDDCAGTPCKPVPISVPGVANAVGVAVGARHACAVRSDGTVACWGNNSDGQLGLGTMTPPASCGGDGGCIPDLAAVVGMSDAVAVAAGVDFTCALRRGGAISCWGYGLDGQLGNGDTKSSPVPVVVQN